MLMKFLIKLFSVTRSFIMHEKKLLSDKNIGKKSDSVFHTLDNFTELPSPRFFQTHLPFNLLPRQIRTGQKKPKIIYLIRNVKDVCVSYYNIYTIIGGFLGTFEELCCLFLSGKSKFICDRSLGYNFFY